MQENFVFLGMSIKPTILVLEVTRENCQKNQKMDLFEGHNFMCKSLSVARSVHKNQNLKKF